MKFNWFVHILIMLYSLLTQLFSSIPITLAITRSTTFLIRVTTSIAVALTVMFPALPNYTCWNLQSLVALAVLLDPCVEEFFRTSAVCFTKQAQVWKHVHELFTLFRSQSVSLLIHKSVWRELATMTTTASTQMQPILRIAPKKRSTITRCLVMNYKVTFNVWIIRLRLYGTIRTTKVILNISLMCALMQTRS